TVERAAVDHGGLAPGPDPSVPGQGEHGAPEPSFIVPEDGGDLWPGGLIAVTCHAQRHIEMRMSWALTDLATDLPVEMGSVSGYADDRGEATLSSTIRATSPGRSRGVQLELEVYTRFGSTPL